MNCSYEHYKYRGTSWSVIMTITSTEGRYELFLWSVKVLRDVMNSSCNCFKQLHTFMNCSYTYTGNDWLYEPIIWTSQAVMGLLWAIHMIITSSGLSSWAVQTVVTTSRSFDRPYDPFMWSQQAMIDFDELFTRSLQAMPNCYELFMWSLQASDKLITNFLCARVKSFQNLSYDSCNHDSLGQSQHFHI